MRKTAVMLKAINSIVNNDNNDNGDYINNNTSNNNNINNKKIVLSGNGPIQCRDRIVYLRHFSVFDVRGLVTLKHCSNKGNPRQV